jgi:glycosyltransferase involved in cell wall biosynthesis
MGAYLFEAIESVEQCRDKNAYEIIIVNDGSIENNTLDILKNLESQGYIIINQNNKGLASARNTGINAANGELILPLDADNKIRPEFIKDSILFFESHKHHSVYYGNAMLFGELEETRIVRDYSFSELLVENYIDACACFRKKDWEKIGGSDENMPVMGFEDWDLWLRFSILGCQFYHGQKVYFEYRVRNDSMISNTAQHRDELVDYIFNKKELINLLNLREDIIAYRKQYVVGKKKNIERVKYTLLLAELKNRLIKKIQFKKKP